MGRLLVVKYTSVDKKTGRVTYRRRYPDDVRNITGWELKTALGLEGSPGLFARYEEVVGNFDLNVARARREAAGQYDKLDSPTIAYLAEKFRAEQLANDEAARWDPEERALYAQVADQVPAHGGVANGPWRDAPASRWSVKSRETLEGMLPLYRSLRATGDLDGIVKC